MNPVVRRGAARIAIGLVLPLSPVAAARAAALANVNGFEAGLLAGKTCAGTFNTGRRQQVSEGALQLRFAIEGGRLTAQFSRVFGTPAYDRAAYALSRGQPVETVAFGPPEAVRGLDVAGDTLHLIDPTGARVTLGYRQGGRLSGSSDPRGSADPRLTRIAFVRLLCR